MAILKILLIVAAYLIVALALGVLVGKCMKAMDPGP